MFGLFSRRPRYGTGLAGPDRQAPQEAGKRDWDFQTLGLAGAELQEADLTHLVLDVFSQGASNTCVAQAWEQAIRMERRRAGLPTDMGSRLFGYSNARAEHGMEKVDLGTFLRSYAWGLKKVGNCPEEDWPFVLRRVNRTPPARCYRKAWAHRGIRGYFKIFDQGDERTAAIRAALAQGKPVVFGTLIDEPFKANDGPTVIDVPRETTVGGHAMCVIGYKWDNVANEYVYKVVNSWGTDWRAGGFCYFTEGFMQWFGLQDCWVVSLF